MFKKFYASCLIFSIMFLNLPVMAACDSNRIEHLDVHKKAPNNCVYINNDVRTVSKGNVLEFAFSEKFFSKCHQAGEMIYFDVPQALYTQEGTLILPANSRIQAEITNIVKPKVFNKNARVSLCFRKIIFPDNSCIDIKATPFTKDGKLKEGPWTTFGKVFASTITLGIVGAGAGVGFAFIPNPARIGTGLAAGIPTGCGIGLILGLVTPGCHYKAKKGETVYALLIDDFTVCGNECK